ncbi:LysE family translocator [Kribbella turkmenica]|uniref:LysE family translocator n=1 Tax=Kribbella turkmenica TaxID=2530375 RepID=A0A4R4WWC8_9ACTN|nr:LysE family translocator [Kribbella turkmenica]
MRGRRSAPARQRQPRKGTHVLVSGEAVLGIALVELGLVIVPGPNMIYLVSRSVAQGRRAGLISLAGVGIGFLVYLLAASAGLATLFALVPEIYTTLKLAGAAYLLWLAWNAFRPGGSSVFATQELEPDGPRKLFGMGLLTCLLNPKIAILYISLLPQFLDPGRGHLGTQSLILGLVQLAVGVAVNAILVVTAGSVAVFLSRRPTWMRIHRYLTGTALAVFAVRLATDRAKPLATH